MKRIAPLSLAAVLFAACAGGRDIVAPASPTLHADLSASVTSYTEPFNSTLLNACTAQDVTIAGTQTFTVSDRTTPGGRDFTRMEGVIDGVATSADGTSAPFHQTATTTVRQASPDSPAYGRSSYTFSIAGVNGAQDFIVRVVTDFVYDPATGTFTTTKSSMKSDCR